MELAARQWSPDGIALLIRNGLDIRSQGVADALVHSAANGCEPCARQLLDAGADVNAVASDTDTALAMARRVRSAPMVALLVSRGARDDGRREGAGVVGMLERLLAIVFAPDGGVLEPRGTSWVEGAAIAGHPVGQALLEVSRGAAAGQSAPGDVPAPDAVSRGLAAGSVLVVNGDAADLHLITFTSVGRADEPGGITTNPRRYSFTRSGGQWTLVPPPAPAQSP